jgi:hypothetical protein
MTGPPDVAQGSKSVLYGGVGAAFVERLRATTSAMRGHGRAPCDRCRCDATFEMPTVSLDLQAPAPSTDRQPQGMTATGQSFGSSP